MTDVAARLAQVRERIDAAIARRGPGPSVRLIGVSKRQPIEAIDVAAAAGLGGGGPPSSASPSPIPRAAPRSASSSTSPRSPRWTS